MTGMDTTGDPKSVPEGPSRLNEYLLISGLLSLTTWILLLLPSFLNERNWSSQKIGWAVGSYFLINLVFQILAGRLADHYGNVRTALVGTAVAGLGGLLYIAALWTTGLIFAARILHAAGAAMVFAGALMQLLKSVPLHLRGRMMGYYGLPGFAMMGLGPVLSEWIVVQWGFKGIFIAIPVIFAAIALTLTRLHRQLGPRGGRPPFSEALRASFPPLKSILSFSVFFGLCFSAWNSFLAPTVHRLGTGAVSAFGIGYGIGAVATRIGISHRLDTGRRRDLAIGTLLIYAMSLALIPHAGRTSQLLVLGLLCGMVHGIYYPALSSIAAERFHPLHTGQAMSLYISASALGMFLGPPLWGSLADQLGYSRMFEAAGLVMALSTVIFVYKRRRLILSHGGEPGARHGH